MLYIFDSTHFLFQPREVRYDLHGHSEPLRISKTCQVFTGAVCPTSEKRVAVLTSEGRILFWDIEFDKVSIVIILLLCDN
jgi:hypothetical protein